MINNCLVHPSVNSYSWVSGEPDPRSTLKSDINSFISHPNMKLFNKELCIRMLSFFSGTTFNAGTFMGPPRLGIPTVIEKPKLFQLGLYPGHEKLPTGLRNATTKQQQNESSEKLTK